MAQRLADLDLTSELKRLRESLAPDRREVLEPSQAFGLSDVKTAKDAVDRLMLRAIRVLKELPADQLIPDHPAVAALSCLLRRPEADRQYFKILPPPQRQAVEAAVKRRPMEWAPDALEWQWAQFVAMFEDVELDPRLPLARQVFGSPALRSTFAALLDLEVLRAWGLVT